MSKIILASRNRGKIAQVKQLFEGSPITVISLEEAGIEGQGEEDGLTYEANALQKALYAHQRTEPGLWTMADDSGLSIHALNGEPGVRTARWGADEGITEEQLADFTLIKLRDVRDRSATFETVVVIIRPDGEQEIFSGTLDGQILEGKRGTMLPGMPFSQIFEPDETGMTFSEMNIELMNSISHRGKAFRWALDFLKKHMIAGPH